MSVCKEETSLCARQRRPARRQPAGKVIPEERARGAIYFGVKFTALLGPCENVREGGHRRSRRRRRRRETQTEIAGARVLALNQPGLNLHSHLRRARRPRTHTTPSGASVRDLGTPAIWSRSAPRRPKRCRGDPTWPRGSANRPPPPSWPWPFRQTRRGRGVNLALNQRV